MQEHRSEERFPDTVWTHDLDGRRKLARDDGRRNGCSGSISGFRCWSVPGPHQSMLYYDI